MQDTIYAPPPWIADPSRVARIGIVTSGYVFVLVHKPRAELVCTLRLREGSHARRDGADDLRELICWAIKQEVFALWLLPSAQQPYYPMRLIETWAHSVRRYLDEQMRPAGYTAHELSNGDQIAGLIVKRTGGGAPVVVYAPWVGDPWALAPLFDQLGSAEPLERAQTLARGLYLAAFLLGQQLRYTPSYTGLAVLRQTLARKPYAIPALSDEWKEAIYQVRPTYIHWHNPRFTPHSGGETLYKFDRNASFLASAGDVGVGDPQLVGEYVPYLPGFYRLSGAASVYMPHLPGPFRSGPVGTAGVYPPYAVHNVWAWEPTIRLAKQQGWRVQIHEGYVWPKEQKHNIFRAWRERLSGARYRAEAYGTAIEGRIARAIIKRASVAAIGRLLQSTGRAVMSVQEAADGDYPIHLYGIDEWGRADGTAEVEATLGRTDLLQPHWWSTIIADAGRALYSQLYRMAHHQPIAAYVDAIYCAQCWPVTEISPLVGKYKLEWARTVDPDVFEHLAEISTATLIKRFAHLEAPGPGATATATATAQLEAAEGALHGSRQGQQGQRQPQSVPLVG